MSSASTSSGSSAGDGRYLVAPLPPPASEKERTERLRFAQKTPLVYGPWRRFKRLFKEAEAAAVTGGPDADLPLLGTLIGRLDRAPLSPPGGADLSGASMKISGLQNISGVVPYGDYLYALGSRYGYADTLVTLDLREDALKPKIVNRANVGGAVGMRLSGDLLYLLGQADWSGPSEIRLYDLSNPAQPAKRGSIRLKGNGVAGAAQGSYGYVAVQEQPYARRGAKFNGLQIIDARDRSHPEIAGEVEVPQPHSIAVSGDLACVLVGGGGFSWSRRPTTGGLRVIDIHDPRRPRIVGSLDLAGAVMVGMTGNTAFVTVGQGGGGTDGLYAFDLSNPGRPRQVGFCATNPANVLTLHGRYAYLGGHQSQIQVVDVSEPTSPKRIGQMPFRQSFMDLRIGEEAAYVAAAYGGLFRLDLENPAQPILSGQPPSRETMGYMKRRSRRALRVLARRAPDRYAEAATEVLLAAGQGQEALDPATQWVALDVLFGGSDRYVQQSHGRGPYTLRNPRLSLRRREEREPAAWNGRLDLVTRLLKETKQQQPWQTYEFALKVLRTAPGASSSQLPELSDAVLERFLASPSPLLQVEATRSVARRIEAEGSATTISAPVLADAFFYAGAARRRALRTRIVEALTGADAERRQAFATRLWERVSRGGVSPTVLFGRRAAAGAALLAEDFPTAVPQEQIQSAAPGLLQSGREDLVGWVHAVLRNLEPAQTSAWLSTLLMIPQEQAAVRDQARDVMVEGMAGKQFDLSVAQWITGMPSAWVRESGWKLLAASATEPEVLRQRWEEILAWDQENDIVATAFRSPDAFRTLGRAQMDMVAFAATLRAKPFLLGLISAEVWEAVSGSMPPALTVQLITLSADDLWTGLRASVLRELSDPARLGAFWSSLIDALAGDTNGRLAGRVLADSAFADTFPLLDDASLLEKRDPLLGPLLLRWAEAHEDQFTKGSAALLEAATHTLPDLRDWALARVRAVGLDLPFALRLLESGLPPSMAMGREFFESVPPGSDREMDYTLALCDSPQKAVRAYGRDFATRRAATLPRADLLTALFQSGDPATQAFVAEALTGPNRGGAPEPPAPETAAWEAEVLQGRNQSRRAKEKIKARRAAPETEPLPDVPTLLDLAQGGTPRDAEWALAQLARIALGGEEIPGFTVEGTFVA